MIEIKHLTKKYGNRIAVNDLSLKLVNGRIYGFLGSVGAGKSTTLNLLAGCLAPTSGSVRINGFDLERQPLKAKRCIGFLPENAPLYEELTPLEYLRFVAEAKGVPYERAERQIREALELTQLGEFGNRLIKKLSKGCRRRVGIAQALLGNPDIIILDEPTAELEPGEIVEIRELIRRLGEIKTVIFSSRLLVEICEICDHVLILSKGKLIANTPIELLRSANDGTLCLRLSVRGDEAGVLETLSSVEGVRDCCVSARRDAGVLELSLTAEGTDGTLRDRIFFAMADKRYAVIGLESRETSLQDALLAMTQEAETAEAEGKATKKQLRPRPKDLERDGEYELIDDDGEEES